MALVLNKLVKIAEGKTHIVDVDVDKKLHIVTVHNSDGKNYSYRDNSQPFDNFARAAMKAYNKGDGALWQYLKSKQKLESGFPNESFSVKGSGGVVKFKLQGTLFGKTKNRFVPDAPLKGDAALKFLRDSTWIKFIDKGKVRPGYLIPTGTPPEVECDISGTLIFITGYEEAEELAREILVEARKSVAHAVSLYAPGADDFVVQ